MRNRLERSDDRRRAPWESISVAFGEIFAPLAASAPVTARRSVPTTKAGAPNSSAPSARFKMSSIASIFEILEKIKFSRS